MTEENKNMDERFKTLDNELNVNYNQSFWGDALADLNDDELDNAFKNAADNIPFSAPFVDAGVEIDNAFLDESFKVFADKITMVYDPSYWKQFDETRTELEMDEAFLSASNDYKSNYNSSFWNEANAALESEGLHYEYNTNYWNEAKVLLEKEDRQKFILRWSAVATILLLISFAGIQSGFMPSIIDNSLHGIVNVEEVEIQNQTNQTDLVESDQHAINNNIISSESATVLKNHSNETNENIRALESTTTLNNNPNSSSDNLTNGNQSLLSGDLLLGGNKANEMNSDNIQSVESSAVTEGANEDVKYEDAIKNTAQNTNTIQTIEQVTNVVEPEARLMGYRTVAETKSTATPLNSISKNDEVESVEEIDIALINNNPRRIANYDFYNAELIQIVALPLKPHFDVNLFAQVGGGNNYSEESYSYNSRLSGGIELLRSTRTNRYEYGLSLQANSIQPNNLNVEHREKIYLYNGKTERTWFKVKYKKLLYLNLNALFNYYIAPKHKLKFGVGVERILSVQSNLAFQQDIRRGIQTENNNWGITEGIQTYDMRFSLGYGFIVNNRFEANINANFGLFDRTENAFMLSDFTDREMNFTIGLNYKLFSGKK